MLSQDKEKVARLAAEGQLIETSSDLVKDPYICKDKKDSVVEMTLPEGNRQIFASRYQTVLPSKEELRRLMDNAE